MSDSLSTRIIARRKFVQSYQDRKLFNEMLEVLEEVEGARPGFFVRTAEGESTADAFVRHTGIKLMNWQRDRLNEGEW